MEAVKESKRPTQAHIPHSYKSKLLIDDREKAECEIVRLEQHSCGITSYDSFTLKASAHFQGEAQVQEGFCPMVQPASEACSLSAEVSGT